MSKNFLKEAVSAIVGKQSEQIADFLNIKKYINEFTIAKKMDMTINQTRNILYKLSDFGLVSYVRKKDKKKGWYTYFWKLEFTKALEFLKDTLVKKMDQIEHQIKSRETKAFYVCEKCSIEFSEENALFHDFGCVECGNILTMMDSSRILKDLRKELDKMKEELHVINGEIIKEKGKLEKVKIREVKKEVVKMAKKRKTAKKKTKKKSTKRKKPAKKGFPKRKMTKKGVRKKRGRTVKIKTSKFSKRVKKSSKKKK